MIRLAPKTSAVSFESILTSVQPYSEAHFANFSQQALGSLAKHGLSINSFLLRRGESFLGFEFSFSLYNGACFFKHFADKVILSFNNILDDNGLRTVYDVTDLIYKLFEPTFFARHLLTANSHMVFAENSTEMPKRFSDPERHLDFIGTLAHFRVRGWETSIRLSIDKSLFLPTGLFVWWTSDFSGLVDTDRLQRAGEAFEKSLHQFDFCTEDAASSAK